MFPGQDSHSSPGKLLPRMLQAHPLHQQQPRTSFSPQKFPFPSHRASLLLSKTSPPPIPSGHLLQASSMLPLVPCHFPARLQTPLWGLSHHKRSLRDLSCPILPSLLIITRCLFVAKGTTYFLPFVLIPGGFGFAASGQLSPYISVLHCNLHAQAP